MMDGFPDDYIRDEMESRYRSLTEGDDQSSAEEDDQESNNADMDVDMDMDMDMEEDEAANAQPSKSSLNIVDNYQRPV